MFLGDWARSNYGKLDDSVAKDQPFPPLPFVPKPAKDFLDKQARAALPVCTVPPPPAAAAQTRLAARAAQKLTTETFIEELRQEIFTQYNEARTDPAKYAANTPGLPPKAVALLLKVKSVVRQTRAQHRQHFLTQSPPHAMGRH